jgi:hypothetical protein
LHFGFPKPFRHQAPAQRAAALTKTFPLFALQAKNRARKSFKCAEKVQESPQSFKRQKV